MKSVIRSVTIDCSGDPYWLGRFWSELLGRPMADDDKPGDPEALIPSKDGEPALLFQHVPEKKADVKNRVHFDVQPLGRTRDEEVERATRLGASVLSDHRQSDGGGWVTFADPEGNEFCVNCSAAEYATLGHPEPVL